MAAPLLPWTTSRRQRSAFHRERFPPPGASGGNTAPGLHGRRSGCWGRPGRGPQQPLGVGPRSEPRPLPCRESGSRGGKLRARGGGRRVRRARAQAPFPPEGKGGHSLLRAPGVGSGAEIRAPEVPVARFPLLSCSLPVTSAVWLFQGTFWKAKDGGSVVPAAPVGVGPVPN